MDFIERREKLRLGADAKTAFLEILKRDVEVSARTHISMSALLALLVHTCT